MRIRSLLLLFLLSNLTQIAYGQANSEKLQINWFEENKWKVGSHQVVKTVHMIELIPENESLEKWTIMAAMISIQGLVNVSMDHAMNLTFEQAKQNASEPKLTLIEKNETDNYPWVIFKIESPNFNFSKKPESQLCYIVQGNQNLYTNMVTIQERSLSQKFVERWTKVFKSSEVVENK